VRNVETVGFTIGVFRGSGDGASAPPRSDREFLDNFCTVLCKLCFTMEP